jgi:hypothetical protein
MRKPYVVPVLREESKLALLTLGGGCISASTCEA